MATLAGATIANTYATLIKLDANDATLVAASGANAIQLKTGDNDTTPIYLNTDRVGIGVNDPSGTLEITQGANAGHALMVHRNLASADSTMVYFHQEHASSGQIALDVANAGTGYCALFRGGNVGIGTTAPDATLHIVSAEEGGISDGSTNVAQLVVECTGHAGGSAGPHIALLKSGEAMDDDYIGKISFLGDDDVGVSAGDTSNATPYAGILARILDETDATTDGALFFQTRVNGASTTSMYMAGGNVGIGTGNVAGYQLDVKDDASSGYVANFMNDGNQGNRYGIRVQCGEDTANLSGEAVYLTCFDGDASNRGGIHNSGTTLTPVFFDGSDRRLKKDIDDTKVDALALINSFSFKEFTYKHGDIKEKCGLIAQDVESIFPEMIGKKIADEGWAKQSDEIDVGDEFYVISKGLLENYLAKAIQELSAKVTALENA